jgi:hypothetical protein
MGGIQRQNIRHPEGVAGRGGMGIKMRHVTKSTANKNRSKTSELLRGRKAGLLENICSISLHRC